MPRNDKTGPLGQGSMTGRKLGACTDNNENAFGFRNMGRRWMNQKGMGRGRNQMVSDSEISDNNYHKEVDKKFDTLMERIAKLEFKLSEKLD